MTSITRPTLVVFDLDDTLYSYESCNLAGNKALFALGASETGVSRKHFETVYSEAREKVKARLGKTGSSHSRLLYVHEALAQLGFSNQPSLALSLEQEFWREYLLAMTLRPGAEDLLLSLRFNHIPIALVTDLTLQIQLRKLVFLKLESFFDVVIASEESAGDKSSLLPFEVLAERSQKEWLEHVWFVGDGKHDGPVEPLKSKKIIGAGWSWIKDAQHSTFQTGWSELSQIEDELEKLIEVNEYKHLA